MTPFTVMTGIAVPIDEANIDTDRLVPARFLQRPRSQGLADALFHDERQSVRCGARFVLDDPRYAGAQILVAGANFGCGSSREHAVYALVDAGFRAVIAPSFGDIFYGNCFRNGLLPIVLPAEAVEAIMRLLTESPGGALAIDLPEQRLSGPALDTLSFPIDALHKYRMIHGLDVLGQTLTLEKDIAAFEQRSAAALRPIALGQDEPASGPRQPISPVR